VIIREWKQVTVPARANYTSDAENVSLLTGAVAGSTLLRTLLWIQLEERVNVPEVSIVPTTPAAAALYHATHSFGNDLQPNIYDYETDWIAYYVPEWFADFGSINATQSDLTYHAHLFVDSKAQRKIVEDDPSCTFAWGPTTGNAPPNAGTRLRTMAISAVARFLYQREA
jgi:hypothetical protein